MKPGGGKAKGSAQERLICKQLSLWITNEERSDILWRSINSGAQTTVYGKKQHKTAKFTGQIGDIAAIDPLGEEFIKYVATEVKFYADLQADNLIFHGPSKLIDFWDHHVEICAEADKLPILIARQNRKSTICLLPVYLDEILFKSPSYISYCNEDTNTSFVVCLLDEFLAKIDYTDFMVAVKSLSSEGIECQ
jgi:hypothetical protein